MRIVSIAAALLAVTGGIAAAQTDRPVRTDEPAGMGSMPNTGGAVTQPDSGGTTGRPDSIIRDRMGGAPEVSRMSEEQIRAKLQADGYREVGPLQPAANGGYTTTAEKNGTKVSLEIEAATGSVRELH